MFFFPEFRLCHKQISQKKFSDIALALTKISDITGIVEEL